jgi:hypothetical protein
MLPILKIFILGGNMAGETLPFNVEDHLDSVEVLKAYVEEFLNADPIDLKELKVALETAAKAAILRS